MRKLRPVLLSAGAAVVALGATAAAALAQQSVPIGSLAGSGVTIEGRVTDVFGNKFVLEDATGRTLVETGPPHAVRVEVRPGETLKVTGEPDEGGFDAFSLTRADGTVVTIRDPKGPPPWAGGPRGGPERGGPRGPGDRADAAPAFGEPELRRIVEGQGYTWQGGVERRPKHLEVRALNPQRELVELHIDARGEIYREERIRY